MIDLLLLRALFPKRFALPVLLEMIQRALLSRIMVRGVLAAVIHIHCLTRPALLTRTLIFAGVGRT